MLVVGNVSEQEVAYLNKGDTGKVRLSNGQIVDASIRYISAIADETTRTFRVEMVADNSSYALRDGITAVVNLPVADTEAHLISSAFLVLNDAGVVGVRTLAGEDMVAFKPVQILGDGPDGTWIQGLNSSENVITVGHQFVRHGQQVRAEFVSPRGGQAR